MAAKRSNYVLGIPIDASQIEDRKDGQGVRVALAQKNEVIQSQTVEFSRDGKGTAKFGFKEPPGPLRVIVGPADAEDNEIVGLRTLQSDVKGAVFEQGRQVELPVVAVSPFYWKWWLRWCRTFTITGRVLCPDGSAVPGAEVCAFDVDSFLFWSNRQQVGCTTTDENGAFSISFRWCCGWRPLWWWRRRSWKFDPQISERLVPSLELDPRLKIGPFPAQPDLKVLNKLFESDLTDLDFDLGRDPSRTSEIRERVLDLLPNVPPQLEAIRLWPWFPWQPWNDCNPDLIFRVTQNCFGENTVLIDESIFDARYNVSTQTDVELVAENNACCIPTPCEDPPCPEGPCLVVDQVCSFQVDQIGGNQVPVETPAGYLNPSNGGSATGKDRPFSGIVPIYRVGAFTGVDYYEILDEFGNPLSGPDPSGWPEVDFFRSFWDTAILDFDSEQFKFETLPGLPLGHRAVKTRERVEVESGLTWDGLGADRHWSTNRNLLCALDTGKLSDGLHRFQVRAWTVGAGGELEGSFLLPVCGSQEDSELALFVENQVPTGPECQILEVRVNGDVVDVCDVVDATSGTLEIDFRVEDAAQHLHSYSLRAEYGLSQSVNLLGPSTGFSLSSSTTQVGPTYGDAVIQGASPPSWAGGLITLTIPLERAFPIPCCYQLVLKAWKRNVLGRRGPGIAFSCTGHPHCSSQFAVGVGVCGDETQDAMLSPELPDGLTLTDPPALPDPRRRA